VANLLRGLTWGGLAGGACLAWHGNGRGWVSEELEQEALRRFRSLSLSHQSSAGSTSTSASASAGREAQAARGTGSGTGWVGADRGGEG
jgi:hypothetical protein